MRNICNFSNVSFSIIQSFQGLARSYAVWYEKNDFLGLKNEMKVVRFLSKPECIQDQFKPECIQFSHYPYWQIVCSFMRFSHLQCSPSFIFSIRWCLYCTKLLSFEVILILNIALKVNVF